MIGREASLLWGKLPATLQEMCCIFLFVVIGMFVGRVFVNTTCQCS